MAVVQEGPWRSLCSGRKVVLAAGLSIGATVGYIIYCHVKSSRSAQCQRTEQTRLSMPLDVYRSIARHQSTFLDLVNQKSGAQVNVLANAEEQSSVCFLLQGTAQQLLLAKCSLEKLASDCELITHVLEVPHTAFGRIIGRGGETLKLINRTSGARVNCPRGCGSSVQEKGKVTITGTRLEVQRAKEMIMEKVLENETVRKRISQSSALRQKRRPPELELLPNAQGHEADSINGESMLSPLTEASLIHTNDSSWLVSSGDHTAENSLKSDEEEILSPASPSEISKFEIPSPDLSFQPGEHLEVYVSASEHPQHFWIQIIGVRSLQLDKLTTEMSRFYNGDSSQEHRVEAIVVGDIVAAPYRDHGKWNRARVLGILGSGLVDVYYVDFGDNGELPRDQLRSMRSDFLSLPFQAIECSLAGVRPAGEIWTETALDEFERMTYCAEWKPLLAKLCSYSHSELSSWPLVKLYDNSDGKVVDLGEELINLGHAVSCQDEGGGLRDGDEARSLQKMLDDMTGATSELSLSCISLSGSALPWGRKQRTWSQACSSSVELERADVEQDASDSLAPSSSFLIHSTPSLRLSELFDHVVESPVSAPSPLARHVFAHRSPAWSSSLPSGSRGRPGLELSPPACVSSSSSSSSSTDAVRAALNSVTLTDDVFLGESSCVATSSSSHLTESELSCLSQGHPGRVWAVMTESGLSCSESGLSTSSSSIRAVWYYLTSSQDSFDTSPSDASPASSNLSSSARRTSSSSCVPGSEDTSPGTSTSLTSSDLADSDGGSEMTGVRSARASAPGQTSQTRCDGNVIRVIDWTDCSSNGSDLKCGHVKKQQFQPEFASEEERFKEGKEEEAVVVVCEEALLIVEADNTMSTRRDFAVREVASISGSVDDVLEDEFN